MSNFYDNKSYFDCVDFTIKYLVINKCKGFLLKV